jgi:hypothetical protein
MKAVYPQPLPVPQVEVLNTNAAWLEWLALMAKKEKMTNV